uniref:Uncharacterized protein n=1 Tax=uncultured bacterium esnapd14 TaxID=1366594 RepID=S5TUU9_9BACT|nr:hypothetical protein [uncultured bacterium esnapd14]
MSGNAFANAAAMMLRQCVPDSEHEAQLRELMTVLDLQRGRRSNTLGWMVTAG